MDDDDDDDDEDDGSVRLGGDGGIWVEVAAIGTLRVALVAGRCLAGCADLWVSRRVAEAAAGARRVPDGVARIGAVIVARVDLPGVGRCDLAHRYLHRGP